MACNISRTYEDRKTIQKLWEAGVKAKEIAEKLETPLSSIYYEQFCAACPYFDCDECPHEQERNKPLWWLTQEADQEAD